jgi:hypothetical protein
MKMAVVMVAVSLWFAPALAERRPATQSFLRNQPDRVVVDAAASEEEARTGHPFSVTVRVAPLKGIHVYAPGNPDYIPVSLSLEPQPGLAYGEPTFPAAEDYFFAPLKEVVKVYSKAFTITQPVQVATDLGKGKDATVPMTITGTLRYQACDDRVCFPPQSAPVSVSVVVRTDRR